MAYQEVDIFHSGSCVHPSYLVTAAQCPSQLWESDPHTVVWSVLSSHPPISLWSNSGVLSHENDSRSLSSLVDPEYNFTVNIIMFKIPFYFEYRKVACPANSTFTHRITRSATLYATSWHLKLSEALHWRILCNYKKMPLCWSLSQPSPNKRHP